MNATCVRLLAAALLAAGTAVAAPALEGHVHTRWTGAEGAPPKIRSMAQTRDGWLWLGTMEGLYRFDGMRFERYPLPPRRSLNRDNIYELHAAPNGDLYISYAAEGLSVLHPDGRVEDLAVPPGQIEAAGSIAVDADGAVWTVSRSIMRYHGGRWQVLDDGPEWSAARRRSLVVDGRGDVWAASARNVWRYERATRRLSKVAEGGGDLLLSPDGRIWLAEAGGSMRVLGRGPARPAWGSHAEGRFSARFDRDGGLWLLGCPQAVCLLPGAGADGAARIATLAPAGALHADPAQLSGSDANGILEDREGNVWIATENGLDRFQRAPFAPSGLPGSGTRYSMAADGEGRMWAADNETGTLWRLYPDRPPEAQRGRADVIAPGPGGALLVGAPRSIQRRRGGAVEEIPLPPGPDGKPVDLTLAGILDDGKVLWTVALERGLLGWRDGKWLPRGAFKLPDKIYQSAPGAPGQLWLATGDGTLVHYDDSKLAVTDVRAIGMAAAIFPGADVLLSGGGGTGVVRDGALRLLRAADPDALRNVSGMVVTGDGDRWLNGAAGVVRIRADDWRRALDAPERPLRYTLLGTLDGYPGQAALESRWATAASADGRNLWLAATGGVVRLDTGALAPNPVAPAPVILGLATATERHAPGAGLRLAPGTASFRIDYTAPALRRPERLRFQYRLDGVDGAWQEAGNRRATSYANVGPGAYVFRVRAFNEDGVGGDAEGTLSFSIAPTLLQSAWFRLLCGAGAALLGVALYRYRVRYLTARMAERLRVKTAERERIARTLHDTFLQTVQGLVLRVDAVAASLPPEDGARRRLEAVLDDAGKAIGEGREQLQELRAGDALVLDDVLADAIARQRALDPGLAIALHIDGERRALDPEVAAEAADVAREALRNAGRHAGAAQVRVTLAYGRQALTVTVADDGAGIPADVLRDGARSGHWGLPGMRERAARIGAGFEIGNPEGGGAQVVLRVPAARAYAGPAAPR